MTMQHAAPNTAAPTKRLIALDVDGTVVHEDNSLSPAVYDAVRAVVDAGHEVMLATGRSFPDCYEVAERLGLMPRRLVCANGASVLRLAEAGGTGMEAYEIDHVETFDASAVLQRVREWLPEGSFMVEEVSGLRRYTEESIDWNTEDGRLVPFEELLDGTPVMRVVVMSPSHTTEQFLKIVEEMGLHQVSYNVGYSSWLDLAPDGVNKATGLARVINDLGYARDQVVIAGDGRNDIEMLEWAVAGGGVGIAMGQAPAEVQAVANHQTLSVDEDGLALALRRVVLGEQ